MGEKEKKRKKMLGAESVSGKMNQRRKQREKERRIKQENETLEIIKYC